MAFEFLTDLQESRMTRNAYNQKALTYADCKEKAYLMLLMLQVMRYYKGHNDTAAKYAYKTVMYRDYSRFRVDSTDLYNFFYFITGDETALGKLKNPGAAAEDRKTTLISVGSLNGFLRSLASLKQTKLNDLEILAKLERELDITNSHYKEIRRRLNTYDTDTTSERQTTVTRLLFAARSKLSDSDLITDFTKLTLDKNLEDLTRTSPEPTLSLPDSVSTADVQNYRFIVNASRLPYIAKFLENALAGKTVVANFVQAYLPILIMIDDIVKAGPSYVAQLKQLHNRAKREGNTR